MTHWEWMESHMGGWGAGHWWAMGLGWFVIVIGLIAIGYALGRASNQDD